jgi:anti-sigma regulatory factor (Ser/Thr protein kinase)
LDRLSIAALVVSAKSRVETMISWPHDSNLMKFIGDVQTSLAADSSRLEIHLTKGGYLDPWAIAFMAAWIADLRAGTEVTFAGDRDQLNYLARMDFFRVSGLPYEEMFRRHPEQGRFIPLSQVTDSKSVQTVIRQICDMTLKQLENSAAFVPAMEWVSNEIVDNIVQHSNTVIPGAVCAQFYPTREQIVIGIVDRGVGIRASLAQGYETKDDISAIRKAVERGVTRSPDAGMGNGLAGSVEIVGLNAGNLKILSGNAIYRRDGPNEEAPRFLGTPIAGTAIRIELKTNRPVDLMQTFMAEKAADWTFLDAEAQRLKEAGGIKVTAECLHTRGRETAKPLRNKVENLLGNYDGAIIFDFDGVSSPSSSFMDELFGRLASKMGRDQFRVRIKVKNMSEKLKALASTAISERLARDGR